MRRLLASRAARHPVWTLRRVAQEGRNILDRSAAGGIYRAVDRARVSRVDFRDLPFLSRATTHGSVDESIRWMGPLNSGGSVREALFCHPDSVVEFRASANHDARVTAFCSLIPIVWDQNDGGVLFTLTATRPNSGRSRTASRLLNPRRRWIDRAWRALRVDIPDAADATDRTVIITLETRTPPGAGAAHAWAVWGDARLEWPQSHGRLAAAARSFLARVRSSGVRSALRYVRDVRPSTHDAQLYAAWLLRNTPSDSDLARLAREQDGFAYRPLISVITPVYNTAPEWLRACIESVRRQAYPRWELCLCDDASTSAATRAVLDEYAGDERLKIHRLTKNAGISEASNQALALATGEFVALLDHDDELAPDALMEIVRRLNEVPAADVVYSDEDKLELDGARSEPHFKPDWAPEHLLSYMYVCHLLVVRRALVVDAGGFRPQCAGAQDYDLLLRLSERTSRIEHVERILYHWRKVPGSTAAVTVAKTWAIDAGRRALEDAAQRRRWDAEVLPGAGPGLYRVRRRIAGAPLVSIVIPTRGGSRGTGPDLAARCLDTLGRLTTYSNYEVLLVTDAGWTSDAVAGVLNGIRHRIVAYGQPPPFNFSRKINVGVAHASGEHVVLLNDDVEVIDGSWLEAMLEFSQDPEIGAVGAKLYYPDGRLQHVGMVLGVAGIAAHAFHQYPGTSPGYFGSNVVVRNYSAVTAACVMSRRRLIEEVGGFDERLPVDFNDVDFCLRVRRAGYRVVYTPYAQLYHHESASFGPRTQDPAGAALMRERWAQEIERDPYYNRHLTREYPDFRLRTEPADGRAD